MYYLEDIFDEELGAAPKKKKKTKIGKKIGKALGAVATGGLSLAAGKLKKTKAAKKVKAVAKKALGSVKAKVSAKIKTPIAKLAAASMPQAKIAAKAKIARVKTKKAGDCKCEDELVKLVSGKLVTELGPPLTQANQILAKMELQRQATYEHKKLMQDAEFKRKVLAFIAGKARNGNRSCQRTIGALRLG
jgi:hypothetical protein